MQAVSLDRRAARERKARILRDELVATYGCVRSDVDRLPLAALFELRWKLLHRLMRAPGGR